MGMMIRILKSTALAPFFFIAILAPLFCNSETVAWCSPTGRISTIEVQPDDSFLEVLTLLRQQFTSSSENLESEFLIDFSSPSTTMKTVASKGPIRDYKKLTSEQQKDISFIIMTLGNGSLTSIASARSAIKKAGERIEDVHPFCFIEHAFSDDKHKAAMHNLKGRALWIWSEFFNGLKTSLDEEAGRNNLTAYIDEFARNLNIDNSLILQSITQKRWKDLMNTLLTQIPRGENADRYNM